MGRSYMSIDRSQDGVYVTEVQCHLCSWSYGLEHDAGEERWQTLWARWCFHVRNLHGVEPETTSLSVLRECKVKPVEWVRPLRRVVRETEFQYRTNHHLISVKLACKHHRVLRNDDEREVLRQRHRWSDLTGEPLELECYTCARVPA